MVSKYFRPIYLFMFGLSVTLIVSFFVFNQIKEKNKSESIQQINRIEKDLNFALEQYSHPLQGNAAFYQTFDYNIDPKIFRKFAKGRRFFSNFKGAIGFGFIRYVKKDEIKKYIISQKKYRDSFELKRMNGETNLEQDLYVIEAVEPMEVNARAVGLVITDEKFRREAAFEAMRTGLPMLSRAIELVQSNQKGYGMLLLYPVYSTVEVPATEAERIQNIVGWAYAPILNKEIAKYVLERNKAAPHFLIEEVGTLKENIEVFANNNKDKSYEFSKKIDTYGVNWYLRYNINYYPMGKYEWILPFLIFLVLCSIFVSIYFYIESTIEERNRIERNDKELKLKIEKIRNEIDRNEVFIRKIVNNIPSLIGYWDKNLINQFCNIEYTAYYGRTTEEIKGIHLSKLLTPETFDANLPYVEKALSGEVQEFERRIVKNDGKCVITNAKYIPDFVDGKVEGFFVVVTDITNYVESTEKIRLLHHAVNHSPVDIEITNKDEVVEYVNENHLKTSGQKAEEVIGKRSNFFENKNLNKELISKIKTSLVENEFWEGEVINHKKNGEEFLEEVSISNVNNEKGDLTHYLFIKRDITKQKEDESKITFTSKLASIGEMAADVAHEINNPLAVIALNIDSLDKKTKRNLMTSDDFYKSLTKINESIKRISRVVTSLSFYSKDSNLGSFNKISIETIIQRAKDLCSEKIKFSGVEFKLNNIGSFDIECNDIQIQQVLFNLLNNAFEAVEGQKNSWVRLDISQDNDNAYFRVIDSGRIDNELVTNIFKPFFSTKKEKNRVGLGLSISLNIAKDHFGRLELLEDQLFTTFQLTIPLKQAADIKKVA